MPDDLLMTKLLGIENYRCGLECAIYTAALAGDPKPSEQEVGLFT